MEKVVIDQLLCCAAMVGIYISYVFKTEKVKVLTMHWFNFGCYIMIYSILKYVVGVSY